MPRAVVGCELVENWDKLREKQIQMHCCLFLKLQQRVESALTNSGDGGARLPVGSGPSTFPQARRLYVGAATLNLNCPIFPIATV